MADILRPILRPIIAPLVQQGLALGTGGGSIWRADNRAASIMEQGLQGGSNTSASYSRARAMPAAFRRFRVLVPVFWTTGSPITDTLFSTVRKFAFALGTTYQASFTGRNADVPVTFGGQPYTPDFDPATWDSNAPLLSGGGVCMVSDLMDIGQTIPANTPFEWRSAVRVPSAAGGLPFSGTYNGTQNTSFGFQASTSDLVTAGIAGVKTFSPISTTDNNNFWDNSIILAEVPAGTKGAISFGDSLLYAVAYDYGDDQGVGGIMNRGLKSRSTMHLNIGRGSDGDFNLITPARWSMRKKLVQVIQALGGGFNYRNHCNIHNDLTKSYTINTVARSTAYAKWGIVVAGGIGCLICTSPGTTDSAALSVGAGINRDIVDGTVRWARLTTSTGGVAQAAAAVAAQSMNVNDQMRAFIDAPAYGWCAGPNTTTKTSGLAAANWGSSTSRRGIFNGFLRDSANWDIWGLSGLLDVNSVLEQSYPTETSLWADTNDTADGTHHTPAGAVKGAAVIGANPAL